MLERPVNGTLPFPSGTGFVAGISTPLLVPDRPATIAADAFVGGIVAGTIVTEEFV